MAEATKTPVTSKASDLPKDIFGVEVRNHELLKLAYEAYLANARQASASTKTRGEVRGGGKKPWKQKGTGRARFGSSRNPIWRGGGIVFGPRGNENYTKKISTNAKRQAIKQALTLAAQAEKVQVLAFEGKVTAKTKDAIAFFENVVNVDPSKKRILLVAEKTPELIRSTSNLQHVLLVSPTYLSVYHILNADAIVIAKSVVPTLAQWLVKEEA